MTLYKIENGIGTYWVVAEDLTEADEKLTKVLDYADYGFIAQRKTITITVIAEEVEDNLTGKFLVL